MSLIRKNKLLIYNLFTAIICLTLLSIMMQFWNADFRVPFRYSDDAIMHAEWVKSVADNGWYLDNSYVGMPSGKNMRDWPMSENFHYFIIKILSLFTGDYSIIFNLFFIIGFPLTALSSFYVFSRIGISPLLSSAGALLYAFIPFHFSRGQSHLFLSSYYHVPLMVLVILEYASGQFDAYFKTNKTRWFFYCVIAAVTSMSGIYYSYFSCLFISVAIIYRYSKDRIPRSVLPGLLLIGIIVVSGLISISSTLFYRIENGKNQYGIMRVYHEVELYSLKITDLLLPAKGHRVHFLSDLKQKYDDESSYLYRFSHGEKDIALGFFGSMGFMLLIFFVLFNRNSSFIKDNESSEIVSILSVLNLLAVLLSVIGGFNSFLAPFLNYSIRAYNRIVVFIAFFSISAMLIVLNDIYKNHMIYNLVKKQKSMRAINAVKLILSIFIVILMIFGIYDQSADGSIPEYKEIIEKYKNDSEFVRAIEKIMPAGTRVFQLPYAQYPECQPVNQMPEYSHMRYYLHTKNLRWSYGAMKGREDDGWQKRAASLDPKEMLRNIKQKKFDGLLIDKRGYSDGGNSLISEITKIIGRNPIFDAKKEVVFFDIREPEKHALHILSSR